MIDMRDDAEVARELDGHEALHYAGASLAGQWNGLVRPPPSGRDEGNLIVLAPVGASAIRRVMPKLVLITPRGSTSIAHELTEELVTIGRGPDNLIQIDDPSVSGRHAQINCVGDIFHLRDLESTNGTAG